MNCLEIEKLVIQYHIMKNGKLICPKELASKTWKDLNKLTCSKEVVLYGAGAMCECFLREYGCDYRIKYIVDSKIKEGEVKYLYNKGVYSPNKLKNESNVVVIITTINNIGEIYENILEMNKCVCFSFAQMEYNKKTNRIGVAYLKLNKKKQKRIEKYIYIRNIERAEIYRLNNRTNDTRQLLGDRYLYLLHMDKMINGLIEQSGNQELKYEQIDYYFKHKYKNEYSPNFFNPESFNEKNIAMQLNEENSQLFARVTDKYEMRKYISEVLSTDKYTLPIYGIWNDEKSVDLSKLPKSFVLKCTNGGDGNRIILVKDKDSISLQDIQFAMSDWVGEYKSLYYSSFNGAFKNVKGRIIAEELLYPEDETDRVLDYKYWMFNGNLGLFYISEEVFDEYGKHVETKVSYYTADKQPYKNVKMRSFEEVENCSIDSRFEEMLEIAEHLAAPFEFLRVDFFVTKSRYVISELTLTPSGGMIPFDSYEMDKEIGRMWRKDIKE